MLDVVFSLLKCSKKIFVTLLGAVVFDPAPPPPTGLPVRWIDDYQKNTLSAVSLRGHEAGVLRICYDFRGSGVNRVDLS